MTDFLFTNDQTLSRTDEIVDYLRLPRLWIPKVEYPDFDEWLSRAHVQLKKEEKRVMIALSQGSIIGAIIYQRHCESVDALEIKNISIRSDVRGRHIASFLLRNAEIEGLRDFGCTRIVLDTKISNHAIRSLLFKSGYKLDDVRDLYGLDSGLDARYSKAVNPGSLVL